MLSRFHLVLECNGQTDGQTDRQTDRFAISISRVSMLTRDKNTTTNIPFQASILAYMASNKPIHYYQSYRNASCLSNS